MFYHCDIHGNKLETKVWLNSDDTDYLAVANCPSEEIRRDLTEQYFQEVRSGKRGVGVVLRFPDKREKDLLATGWRQSAKSPVHPSQW